MLILGISTSSKNPSAAVMRDGMVTAFHYDESGRSHSQTLMGLIENALEGAKASMDDLDYIAVDIGPGSFTGVRIGVSVANAMAFATGKSIIPVNSLSALRNIAGDVDIVCAIINARNGNGYAAVYETGKELLPACPCIIEDMVADLPCDAVIVGDCLGHSDYPNARLVLLEAIRLLSNAPNMVCNETRPLYLRPSQAERMRLNPHSRRCDT